MNIDKLLGIKDQKKIIGTAHAGCKPWLYIKQVQLGKPILGQEPSTAKNILESFSMILLRLFRRKKRQALYCQEIGRIKRCKNPMGGIEAFRVKDKANQQITGAFGIFKGTEEELREQLEKKLETALGINPATIGRGARDENRITRIITHEEAIKTIFGKDETNRTKGELI